MTPSVSSKSHHTGIETSFCFYLSFVVHSSKSHHTGIETDNTNGIIRKNGTPNRTILELKLVDGCYGIAVNVFSKSHHTGIETEAMILAAAASGLQIAPYWNWNRWSCIAASFFRSPNRTILELKLRKSATGGCYRRGSKSHHTGIET